MNQGPGNKCNCMISRKYETYDNFSKWSVYGWIRMRLQQLLSLMQWSYSSLTLSHPYIIYIASKQESPNVSLVNGSHLSPSHRYYLVIRPHDIFPPNPQLNFQYQTACLQSILPCWQPRRNAHISQHCSDTFIFKPYSQYGRILFCFVVGCVENCCLHNMNFI